jgi:hypothetical protein
MFARPRRMVALAKECEHDEQEPPVSCGALFWQRCLPEETNLGAATP